MADLKTTNIFGDAYINNKVGIATNAPATRLQIGQLSPTAATEGIQFGDDTGARLYRGGSSYIQASAGFQAGAQIYASTYLQSGNSQMYPGSYTSTQRFGIGNASGNAWIDGLTIAQGGNVTVYNNLTTPSATISGYITFPNDTSSAGLINTAGTAWLKLDDAYGNMYIVNNQAGAGIYFDSNAYYWRAANGSTSLMSLSGNGDLGAARYLSGTYVNTSDDVSTGNISHIVAKFGDNYHRSATAAKVAAFISGQTMNIGGNAATVTTNANLSGDVTSVGNTTTIANTVVTNAKLKEMGASTIKGNNGASANTPSDLTPAQVATMLSGQTMNIAGSSTSCTGNAATATALTSMNISQFTNNSGYLTSAVTSLAGTTNRITVSGATGAVTLNLPQDIHTGASPTFAGLSLTSVSTTGATITNLTGAYQNTTVYDSPRTQSATPSRGIRAPASSIQFTDSYAIAPFYTYRSTGDWPVPYGIGWGTGGESSGIFQRYASNGSSFGDMIFYTGNDGFGAFSFRRHTWEGTTYFAAGSGELSTELFRVDWAGKATAISFGLTGGFVIDATGAYGQFNNWVHLPGYHGFYSSNNGAHIYPNNGSYGSWRISGTRNSWYGLEFDSGVCLMMNSNEVGFYRIGSGWQMRWTAGTGYVYKGNPGGGTEATILDSSNYTSYTPGLGTNNTLTGINVINNTSNTLINNQSGNLGLTMFQATAGTDAYMTFHIGSDYAAYFGLGGAENDLVYGGWSAGNNRHRILHSGNATYAWNMNQYVRTTDSPTFNTVTANITGNAYNNLSNDYKDIYVYGDVNTYYVVLIQGDYLYSFGRYSVTRGYNWAGPDTWYNATHRGGLTLDWEWSGDTAWGGNDKAIRIIEFNESYSTMVAGLGYPVNGGVIIWLRGGGVNGALYRIRTPVGSNATVTVYDNLSIANHVASTTFTAADSTVFSTRANTNNVSAEILARYPVRGAALLYNENNAVLHAGNYNSYSPTLTGTGASGTWSINVTGNAATATTLQTARNINGTSFNGSAAITTATWGTARTLTIGSTGKSVDGSAAITWSLAEIGAAATNGASNQNFSANSIYPYEWIRFMVDAGIYWQSGTYAGWHIHPQAAWGMSFRSAAATDCGLQLRRSDATSLGAVYSDGTSIGFLTAAFGWGASFTVAGTMNRGTVPLGRIETITAYTILGNNNASAAAVPSALTPAQVATMLSGQTMNIAGSSTSCSGNAATATALTSMNISQFTNNSGYLTSVTNISGNAATATTTDNINGRAFYNRDSGNGLAQDSYTNNGIGYVTSVSLYSQTDGGMYASAYSTSWVHQIYGDFRTGQIAVRGKNNGTLQAWRRVLDETNASYAWNMNQNVRTADTVSFAAVTATTFTGALSGNATSATSATSATFLNSSNYINRCGSSGNANTDFQNTPAGSVRHNGDDANLTNSPGGTWWFYDNYRHSNSSNYWGTQIAWGWEDNANRLATRNITGNSFGGWVYYLNSANYNSYSPTLTGTGASGTWSINITGNAGTATTATQFQNESISNFMRGLAGGTEANIDTYTDNGFRTVAYTGHGKGLLTFNVGSSIGIVQHEYFYNVPNNGWRVRNKTDSSTWSAWGNVVMTNGNQGLLTGTIITSTSNTTVSGLSIGGNAVTAGGLAVHGGTNNEANKIVRTDGNGYINAGWINTPSGDMPDTQSINRIYCSDDQFIRYKGVADFKQQIGLTYKNATPRSANTTDTNYWTGIMGWTGTDWNSMSDWGCGFVDSWDSPANRPPVGTHHVGIQALHYTNGTARYGWQMANGTGNNRWWLRDVWGGSFSTWFEILTSTNYTSFAPSLTGTGASGTWSINITGNAGGSSTSCSGNAATATLATKASTLSQGGGTGTGMTFNWSGQGGQPTWLWGSNDGTNIYVWNPSNFNVNYATSAGSATTANALTTGNTYQVANLGIGVAASNRLHVDGGSPAAGTAGIRIDNAGYLTGVASNNKATFYGYLPLKVSATVTVYIRLWQ